MKKILSIILLLISVNTFAQVDGNYNYTIGLKAFNLMQLPKVLQQVNDADYNLSTLNGGMIKFNDNQMSFRISGHFLKENEYTFKNNCDNCETAEGSLKDFSIKLGFENNFNYSVIQPYFGFDFGYRSSIFTGSLQPSAMNLTLTNPLSATSNKRGAIVAPILGFKINVAKRVSFFAESSLDFFYFYERQETADPTSNSRTFQKYNKLEILMNPVSAGLQIHLVSKN